MKIEDWSNMADTLGFDILKFLDKVSTEFYLPMEQREEAKALANRLLSSDLGTPSPPVPCVEITLNQQKWKIPTDALERVKSELQNGRIIPAIRIVRENTRAGLKEAKDLVELSPELAPYWRAGRPNP